MYKFEFCVIFIEFSICLLANYWHKHLNITSGIEVCVVHINHIVAAAFDARCLYCCISPIHPQLTAIKYSITVCICDLRK